MFLQRPAFLFILLLVTFACQPESSEPDRTSNTSPLFVQLDSTQTGLNFVNLVNDKEDFNILTYRNYYNGGGVAIGDVNNDGLPDVFFTANMGSNKLYLNKGNWQFEDITLSAGVGGSRAWSTGVAMADVNADGWLDIYVCNSGDVAGDNKQNELYINNGGRMNAGAGEPQVAFTEQAADYGLDDQGFSTHASFFDYDLDGDLDCYVLNNSFKNPKRMRLDRTKRTVIDQMGGDKLFRNDGDGHFTDVTAASGIYGSSEGFGLGISVTDLNGDLWPDLYISNDFWERDYLYINQGDGTFSEELTGRMDLCPSSSMGADVADLNNDGLPEIFTTDMLPGDNHRLQTMTMFDPFFFDELEFRETYYYQMMHNCLQVNEGNGYFRETAFMSGLGATDWSWGALLFDFDNDGWRDVLVCNGIYHNITDRDFTDFVTDESNLRNIIQEKGGFDPRDLLPELASTPLANYAYVNRGGLNFENRSRDLGLGTPSFSNGAAYGDLDLDGDLDLIVNNLNMASFVYRNDANQITGNHYLRVEFRGQGQNPLGIGAQVRLVSGDNRQVAAHYLSRGFESSMAPGLLFGLGKNEQIDHLEVIWPDGSRQQLTDVKVDQTLILNQEEAGGEFEPAPAPEALFAENTRQLFPEDALHRENNFNDFDHEPLLIRMVSTEGPKMVRGDVNGDQREDLLLLGSAGSPDQLFFQDAKGAFRKNVQEVFANDQSQESTCGVFFDSDGDGDQDLLIGSGGNELQKGPEHLQIRFYENDGRGQLVKKTGNFPKVIGNFACIRAGDFDGDGDPDLFLGARAIPGNYGLSPRNFLLRNEGNGQWRDITHEAIGTMGMVTEAAWEDLDLDGDLDLIVVGDWMPVTVFYNAGGQFGPPVYVPDSEGWWSALAVADVDRDGLKDLIVGNWGENSKFTASKDYPLELWVKDFDGNGKSEFLMNWRPPLESELKLFSDKKKVTAQMPHLRKKAITFQEYADLTYETLLSPEERRGAIKRTVTQLRSGIFLNRPTGFVWQALPPAAQVAPVYTICAEDLDGDGHLDLWLGGNIFSLQPSVGHQASNHGVLLTGDGHGAFTAVPAGRSGIYLRGEVRDAAWIPRANGSPALVVARNNDSILSFGRID